MKIYVMRGDQQASVYMPECGDEKMLPHNFLSGFKTPNLSADKALAKKYHGKKSFSLPLHLIYPVLRSLPTNKTKLPAS